MLEQGLSVLGEVLTPVPFGGRLRSTFRSEKYSGDDWRGSFSEKLKDELAWELGLVDEVDILDRALDLTNSNWPCPNPNAQTLEEIFESWLGWRVPWVQAGIPVGRLVLRLRGFGTRSVRTLSGLRKSLTSMFRGVIGRDIIMNLHVAKRFLQRALTQGGELQGITFSHLRNAIKLGNYFRDASTGSIAAVHGDIAIIMSVRRNSGKIIIRTIEHSSQFLRGSSRFIRITKPFK